MGEATIRIFGQVIEISKDGDAPIRDANAIYAITQLLRFVYIKHDYGYRGNSEVKTEERILYWCDDSGKILCHRGWLRSITRILKNLQYDVKIVDERPPLVRPNCYEPDWDNLASMFQFRTGQRECILRIATCIRNREGGIIEAAPAFGKTRIIAMLCALYPNAKVDIITHGNELVADLYRNILQVTPDVGCTCAGCKSDKRISVISDMSLRYSSYDADIVLADEVHKLMTDRAANELAKYDHACMFGFTATRDTRIDNLHKRMEGLFGPTIFSMMWQSAKAAGLIVPIVVELHEVNEGPAVSRLSSNMTARKRAAFWQNEARNKAIAVAALEHYNAGRQVLILVETIEHLIFLYKLLPEFAVCFGDDIAKPRLQRIISNFGLSVPKMTRTQRMQLKGQFENRQIMGAIATTVWATGVSFDGLQVLIRADGGASQTNNHQWPGRVARIDPQTNKQCGILVDFVDKFDRWAYVRSLLRLRTYKKNGWSQIYVDRTGERIQSQ